MASERRRAPLTPGLAAFVPSRLAATLPPEAAEGASRLRVARTLLELACAHRGAAVFFDRDGSLTGLMRGARDIGVEARVAAAAGTPGIGARPALTFPLQGDRAAPAFRACAAALADFVADFAKPAKGSPDPSLRQKASTAVTKAAERSSAGLGIAQVAAMLAAALPAAHPLRSKALEALQCVADAEASASGFGSPVGWASLLAPSPAGRPGALVLDLSGLPEPQADLLEELALASLCAQEAEVAAALGQGPVTVMAQAPRGPLGRWAAARITGGGAGDPLPILAFFAPRAGVDSSAIGLSLPDAKFEGDSLALPGLPTPLPLAAPLAAAPLEADEVRALTPDTLKRRLLGEVAEDGENEGEDVFQPLEVGQKVSTTSVKAIRDATGDLDTIARKRAPGAQAVAAKKKGNYEAGDFDLK